MPNWCYNKLTLTGDRQQLKQFLDCGIDFNTAIPYPKHFRQTDEEAERWKTEHPGEYNGPVDGFNSGGYGWCVGHWGTKWNVSPEYQKPVSVTLDRVEYKFETAYSPPIPVVAAWSAKFPDLEFTLSYYEPYAAFKGTYVIKGGKELEDTFEECNGMTDENEK